MRTRQKRTLIGVLFAALLCLLAVLLLFSVPKGGAETASAAGTPRYKIYFDYKYYSGSTLANSDPPLNLDTEKTNVLKSDSHICAKPSQKCEVEFEIYGSYYDDTTGTLAQGGTVKSKEINIAVINSSYAGNSFRIENESGEVVASAPSPSKSISATLADGTYHVTFTGKSNWEQSGPIRDVKRAVKIECTFSFKIDYHVHSYTPTVTKPTCTAEGYTTYQCPCGDTYTDNRTSALGHSYTATTTPATCTSGGYTTNRCTRCGDTYKSNQTSELGHSYDSTTTPATCTTEGYTTHKCSRCGSSYVDNRTDALGHSYTVETSTTCTGEKFIYTCSRCHYSYTETTNENGSGHSFTTKTTAATCTDDGYTVYTCSKCGYSYRDTIAKALGHSYTASVVPATCTEGGHTLYTCSRCGDEYRSGETQALGHRYVMQTFPATCTEGGKTVQRCQVCGYEIPEPDGSLPTGHSYTSRIEKEATCTEDGMSKAVCDKCGDTVETRIPARGHNYEITDVQSSNGNTRRTYTCTVCEASYTQELGDQYEEVCNYVEYLFEQYSPYMIWVFLATAGVWSIAIGVALIIAHKNEDREKAKKMLVNYLVGLVVIFVIVVACPYLVRGIAALVT